MTNGVTAPKGSHESDIPSFMRERSIKLAQMPKADIVDMRTKTHLSDPKTKVGPDGDYYTRSKRPQRKRPPEQIKKERQEQAKQIRSRKAWLNRLLGAVTAGTIILGGGQLADNMTAPHADFNPQGHSIVEVADFMDVQPEALMLANSGMEIASEDVPVNEDIVLVEKYSPYQAEISDLQYRIENDKLTQAEREDLIAEAEALQAKQAAQEELATAYVDSDNKYVYLIPTDYNISVEDIKDAYEIPDEVLKYYNDIDFFWNSDGEGDGYRDYRNARCPEEGIKVPYDKIGADKK